MIFGFSHGREPLQSLLFWSFAHGCTYNKKEVDSISTQRKPAPEQAKKELAEQLWLSYYNQVLFEAGLITETERNRMKNKISALAPSASNGVDRSVLT